MLTKNIMTSDVKTCTPDANVGAAARIMAKHHCGIVPVVDAHGKLLGVVTDRDICLAAGARIRDPDELPVGEIMTTKVYACSPDDEAARALELMKHHTVRRLPRLTTCRTIAAIRCSVHWRTRPRSSSICAPR